MFELQATVLAVHDGDTFTALVELPLGVSLTTHVRVDGIDAAELGSPLGMAARDFLSDLVLNRKVRLRFEHQVRDKYGRLLAEIFDDLRRPGVAISSQMLRHNFATAYSGGKRSPSVG